MPPSKREAQQRANFSHRIHALHEEHGQANYVTAWKFWLISPPSKERDLMRERINQALEKIEDKRVIPLLLETLKVEAKRTQDQRGKKSQCIALVNLICKMPTEQSLDALFEINRFAIENDLNGEDYYKSVTRHITRRLASRRAYADQLIDPKMKATIERQGYNEKPEDIPLVDDLWKKYKPILEMRLGTKKNAMPKADIDLIQSALQITPEK